MREVRNEDRQGWKRQKNERDKKINETREMEGIVQVDMGMGMRMRMDQDQKWGRGACKYNGYIY